MEAAEYQPLSGQAHASASFQEYFLQGSILDIDLSKLLDRLQGICDNVPREQFTDHEQTFVIQSLNAPSVMVKACKALNMPEVPWQMKYIGTTETGDRSKSSLTRSCVTVAVSRDPRKFLEELGFKLQYEVVTKGCFYRKGMIKVTVTKLLRKLPGTSPQEQKFDKVSDSQLVEVSIYAPAGREQAGEDVRQFCEHLKPLVFFEVDHRKVHQMAASS